MKDTIVYVQFKGYPFPLEIGNTPYFFNAYLKVPESTPFYQGLNILGGGYYPRDSICTSLKIYISSIAEAFTSPVNGLKYHLATTGNSTYCTNCILMDEYYPDGFECEITENTEANAVDIFDLFFELNPNALSLRKQK